MATCQQRNLTSSTWFLSFYCIFFPLFFSPFFFSTLLLVNHNFSSFETCPVDIFIFSGTKKIHFFFHSEVRYRSFAYFTLLENFPLFFIYFFLLANVISRTRYDVAACSCLFALIRRHDITKINKEMMKMIN